MANRNQETQKEGRESMAREYGELEAARGIITGLMAEDGADYPKEGLETTVGTYNPLRSVSDEVSRALRSSEFARALVVEAVFSGTFDGVPDEGSLAYELGGRGYPQEEADVLAPWIMEKRQEYLSHVGAKEDSDIGTYNPLRSVSDEVSRALRSSEFAHALVLEAVFSGTFDGVPDEGSLAYELEGRGYPQEEADVLAPWIMEKRQEYLSHVGAKK